MKAVSHALHIPRSSRPDPISTYPCPLRRASALHCCRCSIYATILQLLVCSDLAASSCWAVCFAAASIFILPSLIFISWSIFLCNSSFYKPTGIYLRAKIKPDTSEELINILSHDFDPVTAITASYTGGAVDARWLLTIGNIFSMWQYA